jgi:hypothetical protein
MQLEAKPGSTRLYGSSASVFANILKQVDVSWLAISERLARLASC